MDIIESKEDRLWEEVLEALALGGRLAQLYKIPRGELNGILKRHSQHASSDLKKVYTLIQAKKNEELDGMLIEVGELRILAMLHLLIRCMKCWVESESAIQNVRQKWKVAHS